MWVIGVSESTIIYLKVPSDEDDPNPFIQHTPSNIEFKPPLVSQKCETLFITSLRSEQEQMRSSMWGHMKDDVYDTNNLLGISNPMEHNRQTIKDPVQLKKLILAAEKERTELAR